MTRNGATLHPLPPLTEEIACRLIAEIFEGLRYEAPPTVLGRLREEALVRNLYPLVMGRRLPRCGGGFFFRVLGFGLHLTPVRGLRLLRPDLSHPGQGVRFVVKGELS